jgi:hypothetical protein
MEEVTNKKLSKSTKSVELMMSAIVDAVISIVLTCRVHVTKQPSRTSLVHLFEWYIDQFPLCPLLYKAIQK